MDEPGSTVLNRFKCVDEIYLVWVPDGACVLKFGKNKRFICELLDMWRSMAQMTFEKTKRSIG